MRSALLKHGVRATAAAALVLATSLGGPAVADTAEHGDPQGQAGLGLRAPRPVDVRITASGIESPESAQAGLVSFRVRTDDPNGHFLQAFRPHPGVTVDQVLADLAKAVSHQPVPTAEGISAVRDEAELFGGAQVTPSVSETFTAPITAGELVLLDFGAFLADPAHPVTRTLQLQGHRTSGNPTDFADSLVIERDTADGPRFDVHGLDRAADSILVHNSSSELHEMAVQPVAPGTTDAQIQAVFDRTAPGPLPFTGRPVGLGVLSPGRSALLETRNLPPGTYVLLCFVPDDKTGLPHAVKGMHKVVVLT
ncbi:hypothetical protein [Streptomyces sp. NBC_01443]|uniref:hypothetical protein n=1 Tax=Streptomyces sp. NBC_01443 TaxID=2903868 RepID=UPI0022527FA5|nr:hypothetical protein [Streptomyces sp. NBC_01443]MCX4625555.1 hypothetical protein [Streptomyces sp. NBC_01443]